MRKCGRPVRGTFLAKLAQECSRTRLGRERFTRNSVNPRSSETTASLCWPVTSLPRDPSLVAPSASCSRKNLGTRPWEGPLNSKQPQKHSFSPGRSQSKMQKIPDTTVSAGGAVGDGHHTWDTLLTNRGPSLSGGARVHGCRIRQPFVILSIVLLSLLAQVCCTD